nr:unnamed protein product [Digitaria exilis]
MPVPTGAPSERKPESVLQPSHSMAAKALAMHGRLLLPFLLLSVVSGAYNGASQPSIDRRSFPEGFVFGTASSAYQEDVNIMKDMGMDAYRFSISWTRILPRLQPFVTIFHWDSPQALEDKYKGFLSPKIMFLDPIIKGDYPLSMRKLVGNRLPKFSKEQSELMKGAFDFIGLNYYTAYFAENVPPSNSQNYSYNTDPRANLTGSRNGVPIGPTSASTWYFTFYIYPKGLHELLLYVKETYGNPTVYITENGVPEISNSSLTLQEVLKDHIRTRQGARFARPIIGDY